MQTKKHSKETLMHAIIALNTYTYFTNFSVMIAHERGTLSYYIYIYYHQECIGRWGGVG